jgi:trans-2,3-dihydro-3-hydroxyanthranilate isomerase
VKHDYLGKDNINISVEQGHEIERPSLIYLQARKKDNSFDIHVGGRVIEVASGFLSS